MQIVRGRRSCPCRRPPRRTAPGPASSRRSAAGPSRGCATGSRSRVATSRPCSGRQRPLEQTPTEWSGTRPRTRLRRFSRGQCRPAHGDRRRRSHPLCLVAPIGRRTRRRQHRSGPRFAHRAHARSRTSARPIRPLSWSHRLSSGNLGRTVNVPIGGRHDGAPEVPGRRGRRGPRRRHHHAAGGDAAPRAARLDRRSGDGDARCRSRRRTAPAAGDEARHGRPRHRDATGRRSRRRRSRSPARAGR